MNSNVLSRDAAIIKATDGVYGSNRVNYDLYVMGLCTNDVSYNIGKLVEQNHQKITYDVAQKFPIDKFSAVLKSTATELAQVHGVPKTYNYCQYPSGVEFILSNMQNVNTQNIDAGILKNLLKKYDFESYIGVGGNYGLKTNPNTVTRTAAWSDFTSLSSEIALSIKKVQAATDLTSDSYNELTFSYTAKVAEIINKVEGTSNISNRDKLLAVYPSLMMKELPYNLEGGTNLFSITQRNMLTFHHASLPAQYAKEAGKYGLSNGTLYTYESASVEIEEHGAVQFTIHS